MDQSDFQNILFFKGQMDLDTSPELLESGKYREAFNVRPYNTKSGEVGTITNVQGNTIVEYEFTGLLTDPFIRCIGSKLDLKRKRVYYLVYGQNSDSDQYAYVLYYSYDTQDITTVFSGENVLDFNPDYPIDNIDIIYDDDIGDTLFWTDTNSEPKELNVTAGVNRFNFYTTETSGFEVGDIVFADTESNTFNSLLFIPCECVSDTNDFPEYNYSTGELNSSDWRVLTQGSCYPPFLVSTLFYRKPRTPYFSPNSKFNYDETSTFTESAASLRRKSFQFRYQYVYAWGQPSEWSPISEAVSSQEITSEFFAQGILTPDPDFPSPKSISVRVPIAVSRQDDDTADSITEYPHAMISRVRIAIREVPSNEAPGGWYLWEDIPIEEFYKYSVSDSAISDGFPVLDDPGTYFYNWDTTSYLQTDGGRVVHITVDYDASQTLIPISILETSTNYFRVGKRITTQAISDNRIIDGGVADGMNISKVSVDSMEDNMTFTPTATEVVFSLEENQTEINQFISGATFTQIYGSDRFAEVQFSLSAALGDYNQTFFYDFTINISITSDLDGYTNNVYIKQITGGSSGIPEQYSDFSDFLETVITEAFAGDTEATAPFKKVVLESVSVDNATGQTTLIFKMVPLTGNFLSITTSFINTGIHFYTFDGYLPERTYKPHSIQQFGIVLQDDAGRLSPVITGDWATARIRHYLTNSFDARKWKVRIGGLDSVSVPSEARVMHIVRKRSESYSNFAVFCVSRGNTNSESWAYRKCFNIGSVNLAASIPIPQDTTSNGAQVYLTLDCVSGEDGGAYNSLFNTDVQGFAPEAGDVLRFLYRTDGEGNILERYQAPFTITNYNELWNTVTINYADLLQNEPNLASFMTSADPEPQGTAFTFGIVFEIIKARPQSEQELYWEIAAQLSCTDGSIDIYPAKPYIDLYGDVYMKYRGYCRDYSTLGLPSSTFENYIVIDRNYNDFSRTANNGEGRPNQYLPSLQRGQNYYSEVVRDNIIRYSEQSVQNTDIRRYATVYDANLAEQDNIFGSIELLDAEGDRLNIYQEDKISYRFVGRSITTDLGGNTNALASQPTVLSQPIYNEGFYGISKDSSSFAKAGYRKYFTDTKRGMVYRQSLDGITPISEIGMSGAFKDIFRRARNSFTTPVIRGIVDERTDEYILSITFSEATEVEVTDASPLFFSFNAPSTGVGYKAFRDGENILIDTTPSDKYAPIEFEMFGNQSDSLISTIIQKPGGDQPETYDIIEVSYPTNITLVYSERTGGWTTYLSYTAEWLEQGIQSYHSFFNGQMWLHDLSNTTYNTFHGTEYDTMLTIIGNQLPHLTKFFSTIGVKTGFSSLYVDESDVNTSLDQVSRIPNAMFEDYEGTKWAAFLGEGSGDDVVDGIRLRGRWVSVKLTFPSEEATSLFKVFGVIINAPKSGFTV